MKNYLILFAISTIAFLTSTAYSQQASEISAEKKAVIAEIIKITNAEEQTKEVVEKMFEQSEAMYPVLIDSMIESEKNLSAAEKARIKNELVAKTADMQKRFNQKFINSINFPEFLDQVFYSLYDKFFSVEELNDLLAFYKTPTGQKFNSVMPELSAESIRLTQIYLLPKIDGLMKELMEELKNTGAGKGNPPPPAPPPAKKGK